MIRSGQFRAVALVATLALTETACGASSRSAPARTESAADGSPTPSSSASTGTRRSSATRRVLKLLCKPATSRASDIGTPTSMNGRTGSGGLCGRRLRRSSDAGAETPVGAARLARRQPPPVDC
jgi:hypothetical protein